jgi:hypothetical protein
VSAQDERAFADTALVVTDEVRTLMTRAAKTGQVVVHTARVVDQGDQRPQGADLLFEVARVLHRHGYLREFYATSLPGRRSAGYRITDSGRNLAKTIEERDTIDMALAHMGIET